MSKFYLIGHDVDSVESDGKAYGFELRHIFHDFMGDSIKIAEG